MENTPGQSEHEATLSGPSAKELLAMQEPEAQEAPVEQEELTPTEYRQAVELVQEKGKAAGVRDSEGILNVEAKLNASVYDILSLDYYKLAIHEHQGISMPEYQTDEELREFYILKTEQLITEIIESDADLLFFLDKSARPVSWLLKELWPVFVDDPDKKLPEIKFLNIDANEILNRGSGGMRPTEQEMSDFEPNQEQLDAIRSVYQRPSDDPEVTRTVPNSPNEFTKALIIDEVKVSGATLAMSDKLISQAFPDLEVDTTSWMSGSPKITGRRGYESKIVSQLPPWYSKHYSQGRGIGDTSDNAFLSGPMPGEGQEVLSEALRTDIALIGKDIREGRQSVRPLIGCFPINPTTGEEDTSKPKYKIAMFDRSGNRMVTPQYQEQTAA